MKIHSAVSLSVCISFLIGICLALASPYMASASGMGRLAHGGQVYVPVYPSIYYMGMKKSLELTVTLSVHNISPDQEIMLESVEYFSKTGKLISKMLPQPRKLSPLETTSFVVTQQKEAGGVGANFMVTWKAEKRVSPPVIQGIMIGTTGAQGISFLTDGVTVKEFTP